MTDRLPKWCKYANTALTLYLFLGIPCLLFYGFFGGPWFESSSYLKYHPEAYITGYSCLFFIIIPCVWLYLSAKKRQTKINTIINSLKETGRFIPDKNLEYRMFWQAKYFGIDVRNGTMLYIGIWPGKVMDVIGFQAGSITETATSGSRIDLHTSFVTLPVISLELVTKYASTIANTIHAINRKGYSYPVNFPALVQNKKKEWENMTGLPVPEYF
ncbi:TPA: plasmid IncI1-type surface exclusion protein ExcA [Salmonella enterica]|uniref:Plasmid IncI1-type surface exclusion protein ExcA n=1 Tax=Salmonella enterica TaxID=28901 RepID=A0A754BCL5_SALER|nr:plasmid IncI1-type surface exclusion protein ExcA [Salmonella enterica]EDU1196667.1 plasmid IncI1-type surface exclusion protein ExcA [Salmonella enterica subsp. enterica serovar Heidelberg str. CFSAN000576]HAF8581047.1 plasmid IncI1-type surface exclusion protein ExcA [Salmonella enterica]